jgi:hypothetical protein
VNVLDNARPRPSRRTRGRDFRPSDLPAYQAVVDYRLGSSTGWTATLRSLDGRFPARSVHAPDAEGIFLAVLSGLDDIRIETGRRIESDHVVHDGFATSDTARTA